MFFLRAFRGFGDSCEVAPIDRAQNSPARAAKKARAPKKAVKKAGGGSAKKSLKGKPSVKASKKLVVKNVRSRANGKPKSAPKKPKKLVKRKPIENGEPTSRPYDHHKLLPVIAEVAPVVQDLTFYGDSSDDTFHDVPSLTAILGRSLDAHIDTEPGKQPRPRQSSETKKRRSSAGKRKDGSSKGESKRKSSAKTERLVGTRKQIQGKYLWCTPDSHYSANPPLLPPDLMDSL